jgi:hypothetical protein
MSSTWPEIRSAEPMPYTLTTAVARSTQNPLIAPAITAFEDAMEERGRLRPEAFHVHGFSGRKFRTFMNNLLHDVPAPRYLEIGLFHGASFCSAISNNKVSAVGIDNWTEYGGRPEFFHDNLAKFKNDDSTIQIIESDFRRVDYGSIGRFNILFYDGSHSEQDQYDGVSRPQPAMENQSILIVDDWNWPQVRSGTFRALRDARVQIDYQIEVRTTFANENLPLLHGARSEWHNGCFIAVLTKKD